MKKTLRKDIPVRSKIRSIFPNKKIIRNSAECLLCGDKIESKHVHDFVACKCGEIFVDGGKEYIRRGAKDLNNIKDTSITEK